MPRRPDRDRVLVGTCLGGTRAVDIAVALHVYTRVQLASPLYGIEFCAHDDLTPLRAVNHHLARGASALVSVAPAPLLPSPCLPRPLLPLNPAPRPPPRPSARGAIASLRLRHLRRPRRLRHRRCLRLRRAALRPRHAFGCARAFSVKPGRASYHPSRGARNRVGAKARAYTNQLRAPTPDSSLSMCNSSKRCSGWGRVVFRYMVDVDRSSDAAADAIGVDYGKLDADERLGLRPGVGFVGSGEGLVLRGLERVDQPRDRQQRQHRGSKVGDGGRLFALHSKDAEAERRQQQATQRLTLIWSRARLVSAIAS